MDHPRPNDPNDDGNGIVGVRNAILIEVGFLALIVILLMLHHWHWLF
jgi:hypothetical protein